MDRISYMDSLNKASKHFTTHNMYELSHQYTPRNQTANCVICLTAHLLRFMSGGGWVFFQHVTPTTDTSKIPIQMTMTATTALTATTVSVVDADGGELNKMRPTS